MGHSRHILFYTAMYGAWGSMVGISWYILLILSGTWVLPLHFCMSQQVRLGILFLRECAMAYCSLTLEAARILSVSIQNTYSGGVGWLDVPVWNTAMYANWKVKARLAWQARHFVHWNVILRGRRTFTLLDVAGYLYEKKEEGIARFAPWRCDAIARPSCATLDGHVVGADWWPRGGIAIATPKACQI